MARWPLSSTPRDADGIIKDINIGAQNPTKATVQMVDPSGKTY